MARPRFIALSLLAFLACDSSTPASVPKPPPLPPLPTLVAPVAEPGSGTGAEPSAASELPGAREAPPVRAPRREAPQEKASAKPAKTQRRDPLPPSPSVSAGSANPAPPPASQQPQIIATTPKAAPASKVSVPKTVHFAIDVPPGLQADLDRDPRMQPWVNQVVATIDRCYGSAAKSHGQLGGTIEVLVTMHENARPDADIKQLPPALSPIVACATGGLMRTKMPLFTGKEGARYTVRLRFSP